MLKRFYYETINSLEKVNGSRPAACGLPLEACRVEAYRFRLGIRYFGMEDRVKKMLHFKWNGHAFTRIAAVLMCMMLLVTGCGKQTAAAVSDPEETSFSDASTLIQQAAETPADQRSDFENFLWNEFLESMESDYLSMHFYVEDYKALGIEKPELTLGSVDPAGYADAITENQAVLDELHTFDYDSLKRYEKAAYDTLEFYLENMLVLNRYPEFEEMFNPYNGYLSNFITNFTEFKFRNEEEIQDYLVLIADFDRLIDDMIEVNNDQAARGYFMPDSALTEALSQMRDFVAKGSENPLIVIFNLNSEAVSGLSADKLAEYQAENKRIVEEEVFPAYERAIASLEPLYGSRQNDGGISNYPGGAEYYAALARYMSSTNMTVNQMYSFLDDCIENSLDYFYSVYNFGTVKSVKYTQPEEILNYLQAHLDKFPVGPDVTFEVSYLDPSVADPSIGAYYMSAPIDNYYNNVIRINGDNVSDVTDLYMTLSHEGFPGHLYQFTYFLASDYMNPLTYMLTTMGFQEGWAMYAENIMIRDSGLDESSAAYNEVNTVYGYAYNAQMELGINGMGWTPQDLADYLGYTSGSEFMDTYEYFQALPGTLLAYGFFCFVFTQANSTTDGTLFIINYLFLPTVFYVFMDQYFENTPRVFYGIVTLMGTTSRGLESVFWGDGRFSNSFWTAEFVTGSGSELFIVNLVLNVLICGAATVFMLRLFNRKHTEKVEDVSDSWFGFRTLIPVMAVLTITSPSGLAAYTFRIVFIYVAYVIYRKGVHLKRSDYCVIAVYAALLLMMACVSPADSSFSWLL